MIYIFGPSDHLKKGISQQYVHFFIFRDLVSLNWLLFKSIQILQILTDQHIAKIFSLSWDIKVLKSSRHFRVISGELFKLYEFALNAFSLSKQYHHPTLACVFFSVFPERNLRTKGSNNPEWTKYILKSAKSASADEIHLSIHGWLALLLC